MRLFRKKPYYVLEYYWTQPDDKTDGHFLESFVFRSLDDIKKYLKDAYNAELKAGSFAYLKEKTGHFIKEFGPDASVIAKVRWLREYRR